MNSCNRKIGLVTMAQLLMMLMVNAQINISSVLKVPKTADFNITGDGNNNKWLNTGWQTITERNTSLLNQYQWDIPADRARNTLQYNTQFKIMYSDKGLYCLFQCEDSVITATIKEDYADLFDEDVVEAFFWPDTTLPVYFEYELSPLNYELPLLIINNKGKFMGWKPWDYTAGRKILHAVHVDQNIDASGRIRWTAEIFIPFALLNPINNVPPLKGSQWRANFYRIDYDKNPAYSSWQLTQNNYHDYKNFGTIEFD